MLEVIVIDRNIKLALNMLICWYIHQHIVIMGNSRTDKGYKQKFPHPSFLIYFNISKILFAILK